MTPKKICRVVKEEFGYGWARDNRPNALPSSSEQCLFAVKEDRRVGDEVYKLVRQFLPDSDDAVMANGAIADFDGRWGDTQDLAAIIELGNRIGVEVRVEG